MQINTHTKTSKQPNLKKCNAVRWRCELQNGREVVGVLFLPLAYFHSLSMIQTNPSAIHSPLRPPPNPDFCTVYAPIINNNAVVFSMFFSYSAKAEDASDIDVRHIDVVAGFAAGDQMFREEMICVCVMEGIGVKAN